MSRNPSDAVTRAWIRLNRARDRVLGAIEQDLKAGGCPPLAWYDVLLELSRAPEGRLRPLEIEKVTLLAQYNLSRLLDRLGKEGLGRRGHRARGGGACGRSRSRRSRGWRNTISRACSTGSRRRGWFGASPARTTRADNGA